MTRKLVVLGTTLGILYFAAAALGADRSYKWETAAPGMRIKVTATTRGEHVSGVAHIYQFGKKNTYHFAGTLQGNRLIVSHPDGHTFSGTLTPQGRVEGVLTTKNGQRIPVSASSS